MGIRLKVFLVLGIFGILLIPLAYVVVSKTVLRGFLDVESGHVRENTFRVESALRNNIDEINTKLSDWSQWDDTYEFINTHDSEYVASNLTAQALELLKIDSMLFFDSEKRLVIGSTRDLGPLPGGLEAVFGEHPDLLSFNDPSDSHSGVLMLPGGPFLFAARPIVTSEGEGPIRGSIVFGRFLDEKLVNDISSLTHLRVRFHRVGEELPSMEQEVMTRLIGGEQIVIDAYDENEIMGHILLRDIFGEPVLVTEAAMSRDIFQEGLKSIRLFTVFGGILGLVFAVAVLVLLERIVLSRIVKLSDGVRALGADGSLSVERITLPGRDELSSLASAMSDLFRAVRSSENSLRSQADDLRKFKLAVEYNFDHIVITDPDGVILHANPAVKRVTGFDPEDIVGKTPALWGGQMGKEFYERFWKSIKEDKAPFIGELTNRKKTGERYLAEARVIPILDEEKNIRFFVGLERDITAQRDYERNLLLRNQMIAEEKERSEGILRFLRSIGDGVFAVDRERKLIFMNEAAERLTRKTFDEVSGREPKEAIPFFLDTDPPTECPCPLEAVIDSGKSIHFPENLFLWSDNSKKVHLSGQASPIRDNNDSVVGCVVVFRDVTEKREVDQMKDRFISVAAHQLRTPLGSMRWNMEMVLAGDFGKLPKAVASAVKDLYENSQRLVTIVNDLLDVSRIDQRRASEDPEKTDVLPIIRNVAKTLSPDAKSRNVSVVLPDQKSFPPIMISPKHFYEVLENLLSNAIKYNRVGGSVTVSLEDASNDVLIRISDTGIGIPEADREKIFSKFFRASNAVLKETDGSGLGLSVVKSFVEDDGGTVRFESTEGKGTTFIIEFPKSGPEQSPAERCKTR